MGFIKKAFIGGLFSVVVFDFAFGSSSYGVGSSNGNGFISNILKQVPVTQNGQQQSLYQGLEQMSVELGLDVTPEEWVAQPTKAVDQAFDQLNASLMELYQEAGIEIEPTGNVQQDANQAMAISMQQITDMLNEELNAYNNK